MKIIELTEKIYEMLISKDKEMVAYAEHILDSAETIYVDYKGEKRVIPMNDYEEVVSKETYNWFIRIDYRVAKKTDVWKDRIITSSGDIIKKEEDARKD